MNKVGAYGRRALTVALPICLVALVGRSLWAYYPVFWQQLSAYGPQLGLALLGVVPLLGNAIWEYYWWRDATNQLLKPLDGAALHMRTEVGAKLPPLLPVWDIVAEYRAHYQYLLVITTSYQYCLVRTMQLASLGGGLLLVLVAGTGLAHATMPAKVLFFTFSGLVLYCGTSTRLLKHDQNIAAYLGHYQNYQLLQLECYQYALTQTQGPPPLAATSPPVVLSLNDFLQGLFTKMSQLPTITFGLDPSQVSSPADLAKRLSAG